MWFFDGKRNHRTQKISIIFLWVLWYPLGISAVFLLNMAMEIMSVPIEHGDFPYVCKRLPEVAIKSSCSIVVIGFINKETHQCCMGHIGVRMGHFDM